VFRSKKTLPHLCGGVFLLRPPASLRSPAEIAGRFEPGVPLEKNPAAPVWRRFLVRAVRSCLRCYHHAKKMKAVHNSTPLL